MKRKRDFSWLKNWQIPTLCGGCLFVGFLVGMLIFGAPWHLPPAWGDIPTWITAIATVGLLVGAIVTAIYAIRAFREQSREVRDQAEMLRIQSEQLAEQRTINAQQTKVLELQATELQESLDQRQREARERRSAQASQVFLWEERTIVNAIGKLPEHTVTAYVRNTSEQPVYDVLFSWHADDAPLAQNRRGKPLMPHEADFDSAPVPSGVDPEKFGATVIFRDRAKHWWRAGPDGQFDELSEGTGPPHSWQASSATTGHPHPAAAAAPAQGPP